MKKYLLFITILLLTIVTGCSTEQKSYDLETIKSNIKYISEETMNKELLITFNNNNKESVNIDVSIIFYDGDEEVDQDFNYVEKMQSNGQAVLEFDLPEIKYTHYEIGLEVSVNEDKMRYDDVEYELKETKDFIELHIKNKGKDIINYTNFIIVYYKDKQLVGYDETVVTNIKDKKSSKFYYPYNEKEAIKYDEYKVIVNEAY